MSARLISLFVSFLLVGCTAAPMAALMGYDTMVKRKKWEERAEVGDVYSQYELAQSYCCREYEGKLDGKLAIKWWCKAAKNGHAKSQLQLGKIYEGLDEIKGIQVEKDQSKAFMWYVLAGRRGSITARERVSALKDQLNEVVMNRAKEMTENWKSSDCGIK